MTHPFEHLAPYVDGALDQQARDVVDEHLGSCARCRAEVDAASRGRAAVRALPEASVPDIAASFPPDRVAALRAASPRPTRPWAKVVPALAAAAVVALVALVLPRIGGSGGSAERAADAGGAVAATPEGPLRLEIAGADFDESSLQREAVAFAGRLTAGGSADQAQGGAETSFTAPAQDAKRMAGPAATGRARDCLRSAFPGHPGELVRIIRARFDGAPAYLGYVLEGPGAGRPATLLSIWVAAVEDCSILSLSSTRL